MPVRVIQVDEKSSGQEIQFRWSSIASGTFAILGFGLLFVLLGNAVGLSIKNIVNPGVSGALQAWSWIYTVVTMVFSYYIGSLIATRSNEIASTGSGALHGVSCWGFASFLGVVLAESVSSAMSRILSGAGGDSANWLALCIIGIGLVMATAGGMSGGKKAARYKQVEEGTREREIKVAS